MREIKNFHTMTFVVHEFFFLTETQYTEKKCREAVFQDLHDELR